MVLVKQKAFVRSYDTFLETAFKNDISQVPFHAAHYRPICDLDDTYICILGTQHHVCRNSKRACTLKREIPQKRHTTIIYEFKIQKDYIIYMASQVLKPKVTETVKTTENKKKSTKKHL